MKNFYLSNNYQKEVNYFKIKSGQSQEEWELKAGFIKMTLEDGLSGIVNFLMGEYMKMMKGK